MAFVYHIHKIGIDSAFIQLLTQLLMEQFDTLPIQCRNIEDIYAGVWFKKYFLDKMTAVRT